MYENLIAQNAGLLLAEDINASRLPPAMLFSGRQYSGKLTAALETARVLSCLKGTALWSCACPACSMHRELIHPDLLVTGSRDCLPEIRSAAAAFLRAPSVTTRYLFIRSVRKLLLRFNETAVEADDQKTLKALPVVADINEYLEDLSDPEKAVRKILEYAEKLSTDSLYDALPVAHVRSIAAWSHLSPYGKRKVVIVENADKMQESARNAFLKILEEPPEGIIFILTTSRRGAIMPTILSRVRTYAFIDRPLEKEQEVISRVYHDEIKDGEDLERYFNRFLPVDPTVILEASRAFLRMILVSALDEGRRPLQALPMVLTRSDGTESAVARFASAAELVARLNKCRPAAVWQLLISGLTATLREALLHEAINERESRIFSGWSDLFRQAVEAVQVYNLSPTQALENLALAMREQL